MPTALLALLVLVLGGLAAEPLAETFVTTVSAIQPG